MTTHDTDPPPALTSVPEALPIPRALLDAMLKEAGIGGIAGIPAKIALYLGRDALPPEGRALVLELSKPDVPISIAIDAGETRLRFLIV